MVRIKSQPTQVSGSWSFWVFQQVLDPHLVPSPANFQAPGTGMGTLGMSWRCSSSEHGSKWALRCCACLFFFLLEKSVPQGKGLWAVAVFTAGAALQWAWPLLYAKTFLWCRIVREWRQIKGLRVLLDKVWMIKLCWRSCRCIIEHKLQLVWFCP